MRPGNNDAGTECESVRRQIKATSSAEFSGIGAAAVKAKVLLMPGIHRRHVRRCGECAAPLGQVEGDLCEVCAAGVYLAERIRDRQAMMARVVGA